MKDAEHQQPIAECWRLALTSIVKAMADGDFSLSSSAPDVERLSFAEADSLRQSLTAYGNVTLIELAEEAWNTSFAIWAGTRWDAQVDLWTVEEGRSDLVLHTEIPTGSATRFTASTCPEVGRCSAGI